MREHGTYVKYVADRCRCEGCRKANREYERERRRRKAIGEWNPGSEAWGWVDASRSRRHLAWLSSQGMGWQRAAGAAGLSNGCVSKILYGDYGRGSPPCKRVHRDTEAAILSVRLDDRAPGSRVPAGPAWRMVEDLVAFGVPKVRIARAIGQASGGLQLGKRGVSRRNADAIAGLHGKLMGHPDFRACVLRRRAA